MLMLKFEQIVPDFERWALPAFDTGVSNTEDSLSRSEWTLIVHGACGSIGSVSTKMPRGPATLCQDAPHTVDNASAMAGIT